MKIFASVWLVSVWGMWLAATLGGMEGLAGWSFVLAYLGLAIGLMVGARWVDGIISLVLRLIAVGFALLSLGEVGWLTLFSDGAAGGNVIIPNLPYYASDIVFAYAGLRFFMAAEQLFGISRNWLWGSLGAALIITLITAWSGYKPELGFFTDTADNTINAFASIVFMFLGYATRGGHWSRWAFPASLGFGVRMLGSIYYTLTASTYAYGSPADWLWLTGTTLLYLYLFQKELQPTQTAKNS